jgi:hypothetical protein
VAAATVVSSRVSVGGRNSVSVPVSDAVADAPSLPLSLSFRARRTECADEESGGWLVEARFRDSPPRFLVTSFLGMTP